MKPGAAPGGSGLAHGDRGSGTDPDHAGCASGADLGTGGMGGAGGIGAVAGPVGSGPRPGSAADAGGGAWLVTDTCLFGGGHHIFVEHGARCRYSVGG